MKSHWLISKASSKFYFPFFIAAIIFPLAVFFLARKVQTIQIQDYQVYQSLLESSSSKNREKDSFSKQLRKNVSKDLWMHGKDSLRLKLHSDTSILYFYKDNLQNIEALEELQKVICIVQEALIYELPGGEELTFDSESGWKKKNGEIVAETELAFLTPLARPFQQIRYLQAEKATYHYNSQLFAADNVKITKYRMEGHHPSFDIGTLSPLMTGYAKHVELFIKDDSLSFSAQEWRATFDPSKGSI